MKKLISLFGIVLMLFTVISGCSKTVDEKLCRIEISDSKNNVIAVLENQSQADVTDFFDDAKWMETQPPADRLSTEYIVSVYQEKTKTVVKTANDDEYEKIMEYETFKDSDIVKVSIGGDIVNGIISDEFLDGYYVASSEFFSKVNHTVSLKAA